MREAIGFFGSKIVNHKRPCHYVDDFDDLRSMYPNKPVEKIEELESIGKFVRQHKRYEEMLLSKETPWRLEGPMYQLPLPIHIGVTHTLGYMLGDGLFEALMKGLIPKRRIRDLFFMNFSDLEQSLTTYLVWISTLSKAGIG
jgi:hypothetical protein